jgi:hypothetical protein
MGCVRKIVCVFYQTKKWDDLRIFGLLHHRENKKYKLFYHECCHDMYPKITTQQQDAKNNAEL